MEEKDSFSEFYVSQIKVNPQHNEIQLDGQVTRIQPKVMAVLCYLAQNEDRVISNEELIEHVWQGRVVTHGSVQKSINALRNALAEFDSAAEYVKHFSKRGYQLVQPVRSPKLEAPKPEKTTLSYRWPAISASLMFVVMGIALWAVNGQRQTPANGPEATQELTAATVSTVHSRSNMTTLLYSEVKDATDFGTGAKMPASNPNGRSVAYVKAEGTGEDLAYRVMIQNLDGGTWSVADSPNTWVALEWSPSGRNLIALERWVMEDDSSSYFFKKPIHFYTFHIFTLDFKGERLIEKNRLSQWQGRVASVTWWDENTLEFVASQGGQVAFDRYHYHIPEQQLSILPDLNEGAKPLASAVFNKLTALLSTKDGQVQLEFISEDAGAILAHKLPFTPEKISWSSSGEGILVFDSSGNNSEFYALDGSVSAIEFAAPETEKINYLSFDAQNDSIWAETQLNHFALSAKVQANPGTSIDDVHVLASVSSYDGAVLVVAYANRQGNYISLFSNKGKRELQLEQGIGHIQTLVRSSTPKEILVKTNTGLWMLNIKSVSIEPINSVNLELEPIFYDKNVGELWAIKYDGEIRNIWSLKISDENLKPVTFGSIGSVAATRNAIYFQYLDQAGLWSLDYKSHQIKQVDSSLAANVKLLSVEEKEVYYLSGQTCNESDIFLLDIENEKHSQIVRRSNRDLDTITFHSSGTNLVRECSPFNTGVKRFAR